MSDHDTTATAEAAFNLGLAAQVAKAHLESQGIYPRLYPSAVKYRKRERPPKVPGWFDWTDD